MLCASVSYAQGVINFETAGRQPVPAEPLFSSINQYTVQQRPGTMYVACWAEVPSHGTAYFSSMFAAPSAYKARREFRELVTAQYGTVSQVQCASKFSETVVKDIVQRWKDKASAANSAIVETDWAASTATAVVPLNGPAALTASQ
jgi:hypothetical protein